MKQIIIYLAAIGSLVTACNNDPKKTGSSSVDGDTANTKLVPVNKDSLLSSTGNKVLSILKNKQYDSLVKYFSDSVHFSPYGFIGSGEQTLTAGNFTKLLSDNRKVNWGAFDGSGDPIILTLQQYFEKFVYPADFLKAEKWAIDSFIKTGNSLNNLKKVYPGSRFIEYHFSGFDKDYAGVDWVSLRLVFKEWNNEYLLVAIVHDQWTI
jgi:hypothetical protein